MISPKEFVSVLTENGFKDFTGVPCSFFQAAVNTVLADKALRYTMVPNEGSALALASGSALAGRRTALLIQNSGFGNLINPLTSLNMIYRIPVLVFMSGRAYGVSDEPQHEIIGRTMKDILAAMGVRCAEMAADKAGFAGQVKEAVNYMQTQKLPFFFLVKKGTVEEDTCAAPAREAVYPMKRIDAIRCLTGILKGDELVIATTGKPSRELFSVEDRPEFFYMQGSMGHAPSIALGVALANPARKVVALDGDGALLMHFGVLSSVGHYRPANFYHVVLDNEAYETTGDQDTTSPTTDFAAAALACGYREAFTVDDEASFRTAATQMLKKPGPILVRVKINRQPTDGIARISSKHDSPAIAELFGGKAGK